MTATFAAAARAAAIFGSCASDHFLNPLVGLLIEIPITGVLSELQKSIYGYDLNSYSIIFYDRPEKLSRSL
jgi:hypothetical protein